MKTVVQTSTKVFQASFLESNLVARALRITAFALLTGMAAQIHIPVPGSAVPMTLQTAVVLLAGLKLGSKDGTLSQALYIVAGALGLPFFAGAGGVAALVGPTGGYLVGFMLAAFAMGKLKHLATNWLRTWGLAFVASFAVFAPGVLHLHLFSLGAGLTQSLSQTLLMGFVPFIVGDLVKVTLVATAGRLWR